MLKNAEKAANEICSSLARENYSLKFSGFSALDLYLGLPALPFLWIETNADISVLARLIDNLRFPGVEIADGAADTKDAACYFRCLEMGESSRHFFPLLSFDYDWKKKSFYDPLGVYPVLRGLLKNQKNTLKNTSPDNTVEVPFRGIIEAALILARYGFEAQANFRLAPGERPPPPEMQRAFLCCLLVSPRPELGLQFLKQSGFLDEFWPELASLDDVDQSKEFHPEGNVWNHTLETFRYRKPEGLRNFDLRLSAGLLLHDAGKPVSASSGSHRFDGHAELGARAAANFLRRLEFEASFIDDIFYLVKNHMLPAALKRLPLTKTAEIMANPMFSTLMELYRCDESSSFKGLDEYYENAAAYQTYLKNLKNPYRGADGKKIRKTEMLNIMKRW
jgi:poly(A) polymerase